MTYTTLGARVDLGFPSGGTSGDTYPDLYPNVYPGASTPASDWTDATGWARIPWTITRGRPDESSQISPARCSLTFDNRDGRFTTRNPTGAWYGQIVQNTPLRISVPNSLAGGGTYLRMEDDTTSYASCPDSSGLQITGTLDVRLDMAPTSWAHSSLFAKWGGSGESWALFLNADGTLTLYWNNTSVQAGATSTLPLPNLGRIAVRAVLNTSGQTVTFYTAPTMGGSSTQLGATIATGSTALANGAGQIIQVGTSNFAGVTGQVFEARVYSGATLEANPVFTSQTAGATSFTDGQGNTWTMNGTSEISDRLYRFHGELSSLPKAADPSLHDVASAAAATGVLTRLQLQQSPLNSAMSRAYVRLTGVNLAAYWSGEDGTLATTLASGLSGNPAMSISGTPTLASSSAFACSSALPVMNGATFTGAVLTPGITWTSNVVRFLWAPPAGGETNGAKICRMYTTGTCAWVELTYGTGGTMAIGGYSGSGVQLFASPFEAFGLDGGLWRVSMELSPTGGGVKWNMVTVAPGASSGLQFPGTLTGATIGAVTSVQFGNSGLSQSVMGHFSVQGTDDSLFDLGAPLNAWLGETAGNRYLRLCSEEGIACRIIGFPAVSEPLGYQTAQALAQLLQECETTDMGMQFEPRASLGLGYVTRTALYNQAVAATASWPSRTVAAGFASTGDNLLALNDVTVTNADGTSARQTLDSGPMSTQSPPAGIGRIDTSITVNAATDARLGSLASWYLHVRSVNDDRYPQIPFNMSRPETPVAVALLDIGGYLQLTGTPSWMPPGPVKQLAAGFTETLGPAKFWSIGVNGIPESPYEVAVAGTAHVDTAGSQLAGAVTSAATSMSVATTSGPRWVDSATYASDFPFDVLVGGEQMTVTAITGTSSPQTFTVTRSVNSVVKSHQAGETLALYPTPVVAL